MVESGSEIVYGLNGKIRLVQFVQMAGDERLAERSIKTFWPGAAKMESETKRLVCVIVNCRFVFRIDGASLAWR